MNEHEHPRSTFLSGSDPSPVDIYGEGRKSRYLIVCDHAGNAVPEHLDRLGLTTEQLRDHIAWDPNAWDVSIALADKLQATVVGQRYSRLVVDCNRRASAHDFIAEVSDGVVVPGNQALSPEERRSRIESLMVPYHERIAQECASTAPPSCVIAMHTFTPRLANGVPRPWHIGVISGPDARMRTRIYRHLIDAAPALIIGENVPYTVSMENDYTLPVHAESSGLPYVEFELRNNEFRDNGGRDAVATLLAEAISAACDDLVNVTQGASA